MKLMEEPKILVLGLGNILLKDEGIGVRTIEKLQAEYVFSPNVELMDGGTSGNYLIDAITNCDHLIVVDAVLNRGNPGDIYRLTDLEMSKSGAFKNSMHQNNLLETLAMSAIAGNRPETVVIGMEPNDFTSWGIDLTLAVQTRLEDLTRAVLAEIDECSGSYRSVRS